MLANLGWRRRVLHELNVPMVVLEAGDGPAGSWPRYYDSLRLFSPAAYSSMPGRPFPGDPDRYPPRDDVALYLEQQAAALAVEIQTNTRVATVREENREFVVVAEDGRELPAAGIVAASGSFSNPHRPVFPGQVGFTGEVSHVAEYRNPLPYAGMRVIVVGAGDSAAQVANELAPIADVTLAVRHPLRFIPQRIGGQDVHYWLRETGFDSLPAAWLRKLSGGSLITDSVGFQQSFADGMLDVRPMFTALDRDDVVWSEDERECVDAIILATGYRQVSATCASSVRWTPMVRRCTSAGSRPPTSGSSTSASRTSGRFASNTLRGVGADAAAVIAPLVAWIRDAPAAVGIPEVEPTALTLVD